MNKLLLGFVYGLLAQILTFLQLQGGVKYGWFQKYPIITVLTSIPMGWLFLKSVENLVGHFKSHKYFDDIKDILLVNNCDDDE